jgi:hypothetical protein
MCDRHVCACWGEYLFLSSSPRKKIYDILTPIRQARNYLFVRRQKFLFRFDECAPILQPNLKAGVNLLDTQ